MQKIAIIILLIFHSYQQQTNYKTREGYTYDYSGLIKKPYWQVKGDNTDSGFFSIVYLFNFGKNQPVCEDDQGSYETLDVLGQITDSCEVLGEKGTETISEMIDHKGLIIKQGNGAKCTQSENQQDIGQTKSITFKIFCSSSNDLDWKISNINSYDVTTCNVELSINHSAGCYSRYFSVYKIFKWGVILVLFYLCLGFLYNYKYNQLVGFEALPLNQQQKDKIQLIIQNAKKSANSIKKKLKKIRNPQENSQADEDNYERL